MSASRHPTFEATELFARGVGESTDIVSKEMFTLTDAAGRSLTLRPEGTAPVCRAYVEHGMHKRRQPVKLWYLSSFFRHERAQAGRFRQFWQVGAEAIGSDDPAIDAESITLLSRLLGEMGVRELRLRLSSLGDPASRGEYRETLKAHLHAHQDQLSEEVRGRIELNPLRAFDSDHPGTREVMKSAPLLLDELSVEDLEHFAEVRSLLDAAGIAYEIDPTLVRGLDYYTRTLFEFTSEALGAQSGVGGRGTLRRPHRSARRARHTGYGLGGRGRADLPGGRAPAGRGRQHRAVRRPLGAHPRCQEGRLRPARRGPLRRSRRADGAGGALAQRPARPGRLARRPFRGDRLRGRDHVA